MRPQELQQRLLWGTCVVLAVLAFVVNGATPLGTPVVVNYNVRAETIFSDNTAARSFYTSQAQCMANGMNLFSGESTTRIQRVKALAAARMGAGAGYSTYSSISAMKTAGNTMCTYTNTPFQGSVPPNPDPFFCFFTIQWGLFSEVTQAAQYGNQPGMYVYQGAWDVYTDGVPCGGKSPYVDAFNWDSGARNPQGLNFTLIYTGATAATAPTYANIAATAPSTYYLPVANFITACESQINLANHAQSNAPTQPSFVKGYKELTWVQEHWWVLFLIIAVIILIVLFAILIFCCTTSVPPKEGPPIAPMVLRERNGQAYVNASDDDDSTPKSRDLGLGEMNQSNSGNGDGEVQQQQQRGQQQEMMMMPVPVVDPEDLIQATPSIYSQEDVMQSAEGDSMASDDEDSNQSDEERQR